MAKLQVKKGTASKIVHVFILDNNSADGEGLTGLAYNTSELTAYYIRPGDPENTEIELVDATLGQFTRGGFKEVDATNMPGVYEFHIPADCLKSGADQCVIVLRGAPQMVDLPIEIELIDKTQGELYDKIHSFDSSLTSKVAILSEQTNTLRIQQESLIRELRR